MLVQGSYTTRMLVQRRRKGKGMGDGPKRGWRNVKGVLVGWGGKKGDTEMEAKDAELRIRNRKNSEFQ